MLSLTMMQKLQNIKTPEREDPKKDPKIKN